jgi:hypothetical protein
VAEIIDAYERFGQKHEARIDERIDVKRVISQEVIAAVSPNGNKTGNLSEIPPVNPDNSSVN